MRAPAATLLVCVAAATVAAQTAPDVVITLERTRCLGPCPIYSLRISGDGEVVYEGREFVRVSGIARAKISRRAVQTLVREFRRASFFDLQDHYPSDVLIDDVPSTITSIRVGGRAKRVENVMFGPESLAELEDTIDRVAGSARWARVDAPTLRNLRRQGWNPLGQNGQQYFIEAVVHADVETALAFIRAGMSVRDSDLLAYARTAGMVDLLLRNGCPINGTSHDETPLMIVSRWPVPARVARLLAAGADVNAATPSGRTALMNAAEQSTPQVVSLLVRAGADVNANNGDIGRATALMGSVWHLRPQNVRMLLEAGADVNAVDKEGQTPLSRALSLEQLAKTTSGLPEIQEILKLLRSAGAK